MIKNLIIEKINLLSNELQLLSNDQIRERFQQSKNNIIKTNSIQEDKEIIFAIVKEIMRRFAIEDIVEVSANSKDKYNSETYGFVTISEEDKALYKTKWLVQGEEFKWNMVPYDVQILGGLELNAGKIIQMATGEGKTLVAVAPVVLNAISGKGVHIITTNDYLSKRDYEITCPIYAFLGFTVGTVTNTKRCSNNRKKAYNCDITFGCAFDFIFDYLYDSTSYNKNEIVQRELNYAIIDETDSILIDEGITPCIISQQAPSDKEEIFKELFPIVVEFIQTKSPELYIIDKQREKIELTQEGKFWLEEKSEIRHLYHEEYFDEKINEIKKDKSYSDEQIKALIESEQNKKNHILKQQNAIFQLARALTLFIKDVDYIVEQGKIIIVDQVTGRLKPSHMWENGLHEAIMYKENLNIKNSLDSISAIISIKNYFLMYKKLAGMTGTVITSKEELKEVYNLDIAEIPTNKPIIKKDLGIRVFKNMPSLYDALLEETKRLHSSHRPILIGVSSISFSETIYEKFSQTDLNFQLLNAKTPINEEASIISKAGLENSLTIATSVAGRGTDIKPSQKALSEGGLAVLGVRMANSARIDQQLKGRTGRQGNPGSSQFFVSLEDDILAFLSIEDKKILAQYSDKSNAEGEIVFEEVKKLFHKAQKNKESEDKDSRQKTYFKDDSINEYRINLYNLRKCILQNDSKEKELKEKIFPFLSSPEFLKEYSYHVREVLDKAFPIINAIISSRNSLQGFYVLPILFKDRLSAIKCDTQQFNQSGTTSILQKIEEEIFLFTIDSLWIKFINEINSETISEVEIENLRAKISQKMEQKLRESFLTFDIPTSIQKGQSAVEHRQNKISSFIKSSTAEDLLKSEDKCPCGSRLPYAFCHGRKRL